MSNIERNLIAQDSDFRIKVKMATHIAAGNILSDNESSTTTKNYAQIVISQPEGEGWLSAIVYGVLTNPVIVIDSPEGDIQFQVNSVFKKYADAYYKIVE